MPKPTVVRSTCLKQRVNSPPDTIPNTAVCISDSSTWLNTLTCLLLPLLQPLSSLGGWMPFHVVGLDGLMQSWDYIPGFILVLRQGILCCIPAYVDQSGRSPFAYWPNTQSGGNTIPISFGQPYHHGINRSLRAAFLIRRKRMKNENSYFGGLIQGVSSLLVGMKTTIKVFFHAKTTEQYPENRAELKKCSTVSAVNWSCPHNENNEHRCVACGLCQNSLSQRHHRGNQWNDWNRRRKRRKYENLSIWFRFLHFLSALRQCFVRMMP